MRRVPLILGALLVAPASAASFNCGNAADWFEKTICGDPALSRTDETIATRYKAAMAALSPAGKLLMRDIKDSKATITGTGMDFRFDPYDLGGYVCAGSAAMRWSELKPFIRPEVFAGLATIETPRPVS